jgi:hypothetical protein
VQTDKLNLHYGKLLAQSIQQRPMMKTILTWVAIFLIEALGVIAAWLFVSGWWRIDPSGSIAHMLCGLLLAVAVFIAFFVLFLTPIWILRTNLIVKRAIESAQRDDFKLVHSYLSRSLFPLPKNAEIVRILRHLSKDRKTKPEGISSKLSQYIVMNDMGNYVLNLEGKEKMIKIVNRGLFNADKAEKFGSPKTIKLLMGIAVVVAIIRGAALIIHMLTRH